MDEQLKEDLKFVARAVRLFSRKHDNYLSVSVNIPDVKKQWLTITGKFEDAHGDEYENITFIPEENAWFGYIIKDRSIIDELNEEEANR